MSLVKVVETREDSLFCQQRGRTVIAFLPWMWLGEETVVGLEISAPGFGGGEQRDAIISLCFSLNTVMDLTTSSWAGLGHWWQGRVCKRRDRYGFPPPHLPRLLHLVVQQAQDALISEQKQLKYRCQFLPSWEWVQDGKEYKASSRAMTICKVWWRQRDSRQPCASPWIHCNLSESGHDCQYRQAQSKSWMSTSVQTCAKLQLLLSEQVLGKGLSDVLSWHSSGLVWFICAFILK